MTGCRGRVAPDVRRGLGAHAWSLARTVAGRRWRAARDQPDGNGDGGRDDGDYDGDERCAPTARSAASGAGVPRLAGGTESQRDRCWRTGAGQGPVRAGPSRGPFRAGPLARPFRVRPFRAGPLARPVRARPFRAGPLARPSTTRDACCVRGSSWSPHPAAGGSGCRGRLRPVPRGEPSAARTGPRLVTAPRMAGTVSRSSAIWPGSLRSGHALRRRGRRPGPAAGRRCGT